MFSPISFSQTFGSGHSPYWTKNLYSCRVICPAILGPVDTRGNGSQRRKVFMKKNRVTGAQMVTILHEANKAPVA